MQVVLTGLCITDHRCECEGLFVSDTENFVLCLIICLCLGDNIIATNRDSVKKWTVNVYLFYSSTTGENQTGSSLLK